jgi:GNAT superfamily N-acetyltransferase
LTNPIEIRRAKSCEADFLSALAVRSKAYWGYSEDQVKSFETELTIPSGKIDSDSFDYVVAHDSSVVVGFYALERIGDAGFELEALFVDPAHIGTGIGKRLMHHAVASVRAQGGESLLIQGDPNAENFYLAAGGVRVGDRESESIPGRFLPLFEIKIRDE